MDRNLKFLTKHNNLLVMCEAFGLILRTDAHRFTSFRERTPMLTVASIRIGVGVPVVR